MEEDSMNQEKLASGAKLGWRGLTRRGFIRHGASAGAGLMLGSEIGIAAWTNDEKERKEEGHHRCPPLPRAIPHISAPPGAHFFFPGPVDADPIGSHLN